MLKQIFVLGFTFFALFFGAGNLIFPIKLGWESGLHFPSAVAGFLVTGVGLPILGLAAGTLTSGGIVRFLNEKLGKFFSTIFLTIIYLCIGPLFVIPRTASTSYTIGIMPYLNHHHAVYLFIFSLIYFAIVLGLSLKPGRLANSIGQFLTPILLLTLIILSAFAFYYLGDHVADVKGDFLTTPSFTNGFTAGYMTMDAMGPFAFSMIAFSSLAAMGVTRSKEVIRITIFSCLVAAVCLVLVYISLTWIGNHFPVDAQDIARAQAEQIHEGAYILATAAHQLLGIFGPVVVSLTVALACLTTAAGLTVALSDYFFRHLRENLPFFRYSSYVLLISFLSLLISNLGLNKIIKLSIPVLTFLYPVSILIIFLILLDELFGLHSISCRLTVTVTTFVSLVCVLLPKQSTQFFSNYYHMLGINLSSLTFVWVLPAAFTLLASCLLFHRLRMHHRTDVDNNIVDNHSC